MSKKFAHITLFNIFFNQSFDLALKTNKISPNYFNICKNILNRFRLFKIVVIYHIV